MSYDDRIVRVKDPQYWSSVEDERKYLRNFHPEYDDVPDALVPWPYRISTAPDPEFCPVCGRTLYHHFYGMDTVSGYVEVICIGRWQGLLRWYEGLYVWTTPHFRLTLGKATRLKRGKMAYDTVTGEPMDGPPLPKE